MASRKRPAPKKKSAPSKPARETTSRVVKELAAAAIGQETEAHRADSAFPIAGIGASAGGLEALEELFDNMPDDTGMAFVVVTHQHPGHTSMLPELLRRQTEMPVTEAREGMELQQNHVYVG